MKKYLNLILITVSAVLISASFAPWYFWPAALICLSPIFYLLHFDRLSLKSAFWYGTLLGILIDILSYHWVIHTIEVYGHLPLFAAIPLFFLYAFATNLRYPFFLMAVVYLKHRLPQTGKLSFLSSAYFLYPVLFLFFENVCWQLFPYYGGNLLSGNSILIQVADIIGTRGLTALWLIINLAVFQMILYRKQSGELKSIRPALNFTAVLLLVLTVYGIVRKNTYDAQGKPTLNVAVPQGHTPLAFQSLGSMRAQLTAIVTGMVEQTLQIIAEQKNKGVETDLIVWPESAVPFLTLESSSMLQNHIAYLQNAAKIPFIFNDILRRSEGSYSNVWYLDESGQRVENYQKAFLLPFGEFMPLGERFPKLKSLFPEVSDFTPGTRSVLFHHPKAKLLPLVCYEVIIPEYVRELHQNTGFAANVMINITNDTWFGESIESSQHMELGRMRAIELRMPIVRATNSGISALIHADGNIEGQTPLFTKANAFYRVPMFAPVTTFFARWGNLWLYLIIATGLAVMLYGLILNRRSTPAARL